jgi:hypothetical protein
MFRNICSRMAARRRSGDGSAAALSCVGRGTVATVKAFSFTRAPCIVISTSRLSRWICRVIAAGFAGNWTQYSPPGARVSRQS